MAETKRKFLILYFAKLREESGRNEEEIESNARTPFELYRELQKQHKFSLGKESLQVAINEEFGSWDTALSDRDSIAFLPPIAGG